MGLRLSGQNSASCFFVTTTFHKRRRLGKIPKVYETLAESIENRLNKTSAKLIGYVFMPSHIHLILLLNGSLLSSFMRDFKKFTSQKSLKMFREGNVLWERGYDRVGIWSRNVLLSKLHYIHNNPVKAGLVATPEAWRWSSASDYIKETTDLIPVFKGWI